MDGDFQTHYLAAEQAYGAGDFETARKIILELLSQLEPVPEEGAERDAVLAWRAFVALLAGHIYLYGFQDPAQAENFYGLVLNSNPQDTLRELAEQGLERTRQEQQQEQLIHSEPISDPIEDSYTAPVTATGSSALIADPFLSEASSQVDAVQTTVITTATPWLNEEQSENSADQPPSNQTDTVAAPEPEAESEPQPSDEPEPQPETPSLITEINDLAEPDPEPEPQPTNDLVENSATAIVTIETKPEVVSEMSDEIQKRLEAGRLVVHLPERACRHPSKVRTTARQRADGLGCGKP